MGSQGLSSAFRRLFRKLMGAAIDAAEFSGSSRGVCDGLEQPMQQRGGNFGCALAWLGYQEMQRAPQRAADGGNGVAESGIVFPVPGSSLCAQGANRRRRELTGPERYRPKQAEQDRGGAQDGQIRPLPLGLDAEMARTSWNVTSKRHARRTSHDSAGLRSRSVRATPAVQRAGDRGSAPSGSDKRQASMVPDRCGGRDLDRVLAAAYQSRHDRSASGRRAGEHLGQCGQARALRGGVRAAGGGAAPA